MTGAGADRSDAAAWAAYLDALEEEVLAAGRLAAGDDPVARPSGPFLPPEHLGPLPATLADRARVVLGTLGDVTRAVRGELDRTRQQLDDLGKHDPRGPKPASAFDTLA